MVLPATVVVYHVASSEVNKIPVNPSYLNAMAQGNKGTMGMESIIYDSTASIQQLLDKGFEMPIHFAAVGTNGSVIAGTFRFSQGGKDLDCQITVHPPHHGLTAPVNIMYVDRRGETALVVLRRFEGEPRTEQPVTH
jgi:hypothetical protein